MTSQAAEGWRVIATRYDDGGFFRRQYGAACAATLEGRDFYAFSAELVCEALTHILKPDFSGVGAYAPGEILDACAVTHALLPRHMTLYILDE